MTEIIANIGYARFANAATSDHVELGTYSEGLFYYENNGSTSQFADVQQFAKGFYDIDFNLIIDLSEYDIILSEGKPEFSNGYCLLPIFNPQGSKYFTVIDKTGKRMFEPKLLSSLVNHSGLAVGSIGDYKINCDMLVLKEENKHSIINASGETVIEIDGVLSVSDYHEDLALVVKNIGGMHGEGINSYIEPGRIYYIDKTGKRLF
jgi:hypothetical protein